MTGDTGGPDDLFKAKDQILMAAWMLPNTGELSPAQRKQAMGNFNEYIKKHGLTLDQVARQLGSPRKTTLMDLSSGIYSGNADANIRKVNMWVEQHARARAASLTDRFVSTKVATAMQAAARLVRENQTMGLILGPTGIGKSRCAQALHETTVGSIFIRIMFTYHHPRGLICALADALGVRERAISARRGDFQNQIERVISTLRDSDRLIILDEAQGLNDAALSVLRDIHDLAGVPILLISTKDLHDRIQRSIGPDFGQLFSRFDIIHHLTQGKNAFDGGKMLFTVEDIRALYQVTPIRLASDATQYLQGVANHLGFGSLRTCRMLVTNAVRLVRKRQGLGEDEPVTVTASDLALVESKLRQESSEQDTAKERRKQVAASATM